MQQFGPILWNFYGATETGLVTLAGPGDHVRRPGTIGRALRGNEIRLLDDAGAAVPPGEVGELYARNPTMIAGDHRNDEATRSSQRDGFFSVGDLARIDADGYYYFVDRLADYVRSRGHNISSLEVEAEVRTHPDVIDCACVGVPSAIAALEGDADGRAAVTRDDDVKVVVVRTPGAFYKLRMDSYYDDAGTGGKLSFRWAAIPGPVGP